MADYRKLVLSLVVLMGLSMTFSGVAYAEDKDSSYSHQHITATWDSGLVCGDHKCALGESPQYPTPVTPVKGH